MGRNRHAVLYIKMKICFYYNFIELIQHAPHQAHPLIKCVLKFSDPDIVFIVPGKNVSQPVRVHVIHKNIHTM